MNVMSDFRWFERILLDLLFELPVSHSKAVVLSSMFHPGIDEKGLQISIRSLGIVEYTPLSCAVAAANTLIFVNYSQKLRRGFRINGVFDGHENGPLIGFWFRKQ